MRKRNRFSWRLSIGKTVLYLSPSPYEEWKIEEGGPYVQREDLVYQYVIGPLCLVLVRRGGARQYRQQRAEREAKRQAAQPLTLLRPSIPPAVPESDLRSPIAAGRQGRMKPTADEAAELEAEIKRMFAEMEQADVRIKRLQEETDILRAETRAILAVLKVM
jgi:hypothetical protein